MKKTIVLLAIPFVAIGALAGFVFHALRGGFEWMEKYMWEKLE
jgi:hypothetical protein